MKSKFIPIIFFLAIIILLGFLSYHFYLKDMIFEPAYMSYASQCIPHGEQIALDNGYFSVGQTSYNSVTGNISVEIDADYAKTDTDNTVLRHEYCHVSQFRNKRAFSCFFSIGNYINEVECYIAEYLPDDIYVRIYGNYS